MYSHESAFYRFQHRSPAAASGISSLLQQTPIPISEIKRENDFTATENPSRNVAGVSSRGESPPQIRLPEYDDSFCVQCQAPRASCGHGAFAAAPPSSPSEATAPPQTTPSLPSPSSHKQWQCDICLKTFTTKYFLKKHNRLHTGRSHANVINRMRHEQVILNISSSGETPYACHLCGRAFTFQQSYHKHMLYHTDEKPYTW